VKRLKEEIPDILKSSTKLTRRVFLIYCPAYFVVGKSYHPYQAVF